MGVDPQKRTKSAVATKADGNLYFPTCFLASQKLGDGNEIVERVLFKIDRVLKESERKMAQAQPRNVRMASRTEEEEDAFVRSGMAAIEVEHARYLKSNPNGGKSCIAVPTDAYESLLHEAFHGLPLSILSKDKTASSI